ncbi:protein HUA2-LIKE 2-like isoform X2 [Pyrus communis]|uniref:protein HUA2-LIKE 2-like isoform X2 n=1 Tax=Pyrus communis TaxID=23211 RepID=UPI0035C062A6
MAPSRRKGVSKAAQAAAACRQWKVGDLVLAKVKGFPAWPATVSEPEKWGYSADWKKVLVFFFGTQQIAFCNPADVEAFTEEKKQSLLGKRHGKGADFVRAVKEIIDSYDKLKKEDQVDDFKSTANGRNTVDSLSNLRSEDQSEVPEAILDSHSKSSHSTIDRNEPSVSVEDASATAQVDAMHDKEALIEEPAATATVTETPLPVTYSSRKRSRDLRSQKEEAQARRSRSSSRMESRRVRNSRMSCDDDDKNAGEVSGNVVRNGCLRRNKRVRKSPDASECDDVNSAAFVSNGCIEDNGSEVATVDSDTFSLNEGSAVDSGCKGEHSEAVAECLDGDAELVKRLDLQIKAVVIKKKRKPNRKRITNDAAEPIAMVDKETVLEVKQSSNQTIQNDCGKMNGNSSKEDGDEHLPLVKRARVRMGKPCSAHEEVASFAHTEESHKEVVLNPLGPVSTSSNCDENCPSGRDSSVVNEVLDNITPSGGCSGILGNRPQLWNTKNDQSFGCSVDGEAVLPPSKRLHRALEAMSANAAEDDRCNYESSVTKMSTIGCHHSSTSSCPAMTVESNTGTGLGLQSEDSLGINASGVDASGFSTSLNPVVLEENAKSVVVVNADKKTESPNTQSHECSINELPDSGDHVGGKDLSGGFSDCHIMGRPVHLSPNMDRSEAGTGLNESSIDELPTKDKNKDKDELSHCEAENPDIECDTSEHTLKSIDPPVSGTNHGISEFSPLNMASPLHYGEEGPGEKVEGLESHVQDTREVNDIFDVVKEVENKQTENDPSSVSYPNEYLGDKNVSGIRSSPSLTDGGDSIAHASPLNTSACHMSTSDSSNILQNNGSCSPDGDLQNRRTSSIQLGEDGKSESVVSQRSKSVSKYSEIHATLLSFDTMLGTLTRTKESIGRATRVAMDCGKLGVAAKVLEILARYLETESSLHRRVDLFFLVDSIAQCTRGLKGDGCGMYPSAIQAILPRLLSAAAPPGSSAHENRRQCLKVLKLWSERRIVPESIIHRHMRELDTYGVSSSSGAYGRRSARTERSLDDPLREMEGMLVDEYGSNSSFQLPGFCMPRMLKDEDDGCDSDGESFEAVTPEHNPQAHEEQETTPATERHRHILEDVDGELEMEDVAPSCDVDVSSSCGVAGANGVQASHNQFEQNCGPYFAPPLPRDVPPSSPPLPSSPPPPPPPPPLPPPHVVHPPCAMPDAYMSSVDSKSYTDAHNVHGNRVHPPPQQLNSPRVNHTIPDAVHYLAPECRDHQRQMPDSTSCSYSSFPTYSERNVTHSDGATFHNEGYPLRPPHAPPSNQFSYVQGDQPVKPQCEAPPPYHNRFDYGDRENYYNNHERMKPGPYEPCDSWRFPSHYFSGPRYPDKGKMSYGTGPYAGPPCEPTRGPGQDWRYPPRLMSHRDSMPFRPPFEGPIPITGRGNVNLGIKMGGSQSVSEKSIHEFTVKDSRGKEVDLSVYKGKVVLVVNVASKCGFTDTNYTQLTELYTKYKEKGFEILAFPCNQFLRQEPGTSQDAEQFACTRYKAEYPIFKKVRVNGPDTEPVYKFLKASKSGFLGSRIKWNFTKFLVDKDGHVIERYGPTTSPLNIEADIKKALGEV